MVENFPPFSFAYQPIINIAGKSILAYEALVRGPNNESAATVLNKIPDAERYKFDEFMRSKTIPFAAHLGIDCTLNLNLSPGSLGLSANPLLATLEAAAEAKLPFEKITLEITENEVIDNIKSFSQIMNEYRRMGISVAIDDFGSGYSGLNLLADFQPDFIKIDMLLIRDIHKSGPRQAIIRGTIRTCLDLGIDMIAEGVETDKEYLWCLDEGINLFQGFFFAKPGFESLPAAFFPS